MKFIVRDAKLTRVTVEVARVATEKGGTGRSLLHFPVEGKEPFRTVEVPDVFADKIDPRVLKKLARAASDEPAGE